LRKSSLAQKEEKHVGRAKLALLLNVHLFCKNLFELQKFAAAKILETMNQAKDLYKSLMEEVSYQAMFHNAKRLFEFSHF